MIRSKLDRIALYSSVRLYYRARGLTHLFVQAWQHLEGPKQSREGENQSLNSKRSTRASASPKTESADTKDERSLLLTVRSERTCDQIRLDKAFHYRSSIFQVERPQDPQSPSCCAALRIRWRPAKKRICSRASHKRFQQSSCPLESSSRL